MLPLNDVAFRWSWRDLPDICRRDLGLEETAVDAFYHCRQVCPFWDYVGDLKACIAPDPLLSIDLA